MKKSVPIACFLVLASGGPGFFSTPAHAGERGAHVHKMSAAPDQSWEESFKDIWNRDKLTGNWGRDLHDHGLDVGLRLSQYYQNVASGGVNENGEYGGTMDYRVNLDGKKVFGLWEGLSFNLHARTRFGKDVNADAGPFVLQNTGMLSPLPGDYHGTDITGLIASQYFPFFYDRLALVTLGQVSLLDTLTMFWPNLGFGQEGFWNINSTISALPWFGAARGLSLYGGYATTINQTYQGPETGFVVLGTENESTSWGSLGNAFEEVWLAAFQRLYWDLDDKMGYFMVFGGYSTKGQPSNDPNDIVVIPGQNLVNTKEKKPWDIALYLYQDFWQAEGNPDRKATLLIGGTVGPDNPQFAQYNLFANVEFFGVMASRPHDRMGVAWWKNWLSDDFKDLVSPVVDLQNLWGVELYYNIALNKWLHLTPDLQLVENARKRNDLAVISGVRLVMDF